jgi:hypothetical protein
MALLGKEIMEGVLLELLVLRTTQQVEVEPALLELPLLLVEHTVVLVALELHLILLALEFYMLEEAVAEEHLVERILL